MKVICIDAEAYPDNLEYETDDLLVEGETYEVIDVYLDEGYIFFELDINEGFGYWENCFARCSNVDETETIKQQEDVF